MLTGKPAWKPELVPEPCVTPVIDEWLKRQMPNQSKASYLLRNIHEKAFAQRNNFRVPATYEPGDFVRVHNRRWPHRKFPKLASQWQGPYKILKVMFNALML